MSVEEMAAPALVAECRHIRPEEATKYPCGVSKFPITAPGNRISNGWEAAKHSLPWHVFLMMYDSPEERRGEQCGGSLIRIKPANVTDLVLTAAHCVKSPRTLMDHPVDRMVVVVGVHDRTDPRRTKVRVKKFVTANYKGDKGGKENDIALLRLKNGVPYTDYTRPVCLPSKSDKLPVGKECYVSGHGATFMLNPASTSNKLLMVDVNILTEEQCSKDMDPGKPFNHSIQFCAGSNDRSARAGDSGGPLVCKKENSFVLYGIVSFGSNDARYFDRSGKYTFVPPFVEWIEQMEKQLPPSDEKLPVDAVHEYLTQNEMAQIERNKTLNAMKKPTRVAQKPVALSPSEYKCGVPSPEYPILLSPTGMNRIVNGWEAEKHSLPWMVLLNSPDPYNKHVTQSCGGSLIQVHPGNRTDLVLTAAHCLKKTADSPDKKPSDISVFVGIHHQYADDSVRKRVMVQSYKIHEKYDPKQFHNDIALLKLEKAVPFSEITRPVCLPEQDEEIEVGTVCLIAGWGKTSHHATILESELKMTTAPVADFNECSQNLPITVYEEQVLCTKPESRRGFCYGDSGGPLICKQNDRWVQFGVVSFSPQRCATTFDKYARVSNYIEWIVQQDKLLPGTKEEFPYEDLVEYRSPMEIVTGTRKPSSVSSPWLSRF
ncbi:transmembrane serine protease; coagulation factor ix [Trichuris trichiura]|uniref:limulus clotting factor C n=1 Tax=Trichuris trichiura TaxID=36087 RepID=A0A077ZGL8_TRITR|nr:transmembrane serine protease; coagulation factor ix [Trichuris trichiura]